MNALGVAVHEAGHSLIAHVLGRGCNGIDFYAVKAGSEEYAGQMWPRYTAEFPCLPEEQMDTGRLEAEMLVLMGGEVDQQEFGIPIEEVGVTDDRIRVNRLVRRLVALDADYDGNVEVKSAERKAFLQARVANIVRLNRIGIQAVADAFMRGRPRCFLEGEEISALLTGNSDSGDGWEE